MASTAQAHNEAQLARLSRLPDQIRSRMRAIVAAQANAQVQDMQRRFKGRPGLISRSHWLKRSFRSRVEDTPKGPVASAFTVGTGTRTKTGQPYTGVQEYGATIRPVRARALVFQVDGKLVITKKVVIPPRLRFFESFVGRDSERRSKLDREIRDVIKAN